MKGWHTWGGLNNCKAEGRKFERPRFWHFAKPHTYIHLNVNTDFNVNANINADAKGSKTTHKSKNDDGATHKGDEPIEHQFDSNKGTSSFQA